MISFVDFSLRHLYPLTDDATRGGDSALIGKAITMAIAYEILSDNPSDKRDARIFVATWVEVLACEKGADCPPVPELRDLF